MHTNDLNFLVHSLNFLIYKNTPWKDIILIARIWYEYCMWEGEDGKQQCYNIYFDPLEKLKKNKNN